MFYLIIIKFKDNITTNIISVNIAIEIRMKKILIIIVDNALSLDKNLR